MTNTLTERIKKVIREELIEDDVLSVLLDTLEVLSKKEETKAIPWDNNQTNTVTLPYIKPNQFYDDVTHTMPFRHGDQIWCSING